MKIYTKTGDKGETSLSGGERVLKSSSRVEAFGIIDELNSTLGIARSFIEVEFVDTQLFKIQNNLFVLGSESATPLDKIMLNSGKPRLENTIQNSDARELENWIDELDKQLEPLRFFILPAGGKAASFLHLSRATCRRAERVFVKLNSEEPVREELLKYINRLSDYLFVLARYISKQNGEQENYWNPNKR